MYSFPNFEPVFCSMSGSNFCFLTCMQVSQRTVRWSGIPISLRIFQFVVIHTVKSCSIVIEAEVDVFLEFPCFFYDPTNVAIWSLVLLPFIKGVLQFSSVTQSCPTLCDPLNPSTPGLPIRGSSHSHLTFALLFTTAALCAMSTD